MLQAGGVVSDRARPSPWTEGGSEGPVDPAELCALIDRFLEEMHRKRDHLLADLAAGRAPRALPGTGQPQPPTH